MNAPWVVHLLASLPGSTRLAFAPGRINLIGEHTDYSGLPVLPFALGSGVVIAARSNGSDHLAVASMEPQRFPAGRVRLSELSARPPSGTWIDYVVAGLRLHAPREGHDLLVGGDLPVAAGLSSSSALVCAAAVLWAPEDVDRTALAERAAVAERYVGTHSGGMDQAASLLGEAGHALLLRFRPLRAELVPVPEPLAVVVADSGVRAEKGGVAQAAYNQRVAECRAAATLLGAPAGGLLGDVAGDDRTARAAALADPVLARRARFVFEEADRVLAAAAALRAGDLPRLGALIDASHEGLRADYEVSHPAVDALVAAARRRGALGARIVGAGFGGCMIALTTVDRAADLAAALRAASAKSAFVARASDGARRIAGA